MPGTATMNPSILVDDLAGLIDDLRTDLHTDFGVRAFRVYTVKRTWDGEAIGDGNAVEVETEITPQPWVQPWGLFNKLEPCGIDEAGTVTVTEVSITYTEPELVGAVGDLDEWFIRIKEAHGQLNPVRDFVHEMPPYIDRVQSMGWIMKLRRAA